jgi:hypothetical protein
MARATGISLHSGQRIGDAHRLQPHRLRSFKRSNDLVFAEKVEEIVGLYMDPPMHTVVLSIDKKCQIQCQIQALGRTQPGLLQRHPRWVFHPDLGLVAQRRRGLLLSAEQGAYDDECSNPPPILSSPSPAASASTTPPRSHSDGPSPPIPSAPSSTYCLHLPNEALH